MRQPPGDATTGKLALAARHDALAANPLTQ
jgi:hypothetical protein